MSSQDFEFNELTHKLAELKPGELPLDIFNQIARLTVTPVLEVVPFYRDSSGAVNVLLLRRDANDLYWPSMYYVPGTIILPSDKSGSYDDALSRVLHEKLSSYRTSKPTFVATQLCEVSRGMELALIFWVELQNEPEKAALFNPSSLPATIIEPQSAFIDLALKEYLTTDQN